MEMDYNEWMHMYDNSQILLLTIIDPMNCHDDMVNFDRSIEKFIERDMLNLFPKKQYKKQVNGYITTYTFPFDKDVTFYFNRGYLVKVTGVYKNESFQLYLQKYKPSSHDRYELCCMEGVVYDN